MGAAAANIGEQALSYLKDSLGAFRIFALNPVGGLSQAFERVGESRAVGVGITFGVVCALLLLLGTYLILPPWVRPRGFGGFLRILLGAFVPFLALTGATFIARMSLRGKRNFPGDLFVAGTASLPLGLAVVLGGVLGAANFEVIAVLVLFAVCLTVLILFAGLTRIAELPEKLAVWIVPLVLLVTAWFSKIVYAFLFQNMF